MLCQSFPYPSTKTFDKNLFAKPSGCPRVPSLLAIHLTLNLTSFGFHEVLLLWPFPSTTNVLTWFFQYRIFTPTSDPVSSLPPFPLIPLPDAAIMLKPQPPQQTSQPQQPPPTQQAVARRPAGGTSPPNGGLPAPLASASAPPGPPAAASPCLGPAAAAGSGLRRGPEGILAPQPPPPQQQQHQERPGPAAIGGTR